MLQVAAGEWRRGWMRCQEALFLAADCACAFADKEEALLQAAVRNDVTNVRVVFMMGMIHWVLSA